MNNQLTILVAEDNKDDAVMITRALKKAGVIEPAYFVANGEQAIEYLSGKGAFADRAAYPLPWLAMFDFKMPKKSGFEVLEWVRHQKNLEQLPVLILSSSDAQKDIETAHRLGASSYMVKPSSLDAMAREIRTFYTFWRPSAQRFMCSNPENPSSAAGNQKR